jgi:hypothetical protein
VWSGGWALSLLPVETDVDVSAMVCNVLTVATFGDVMFARMSVRAQ